MKKRKVYDATFCVRRVKVPSKIRQSPFIQDNYATYSYILNYGPSSIWSSQFNNRLSNTWAVEERESKLNERWQNVLPFERNNSQSQSDINNSSNKKIGIMSKMAQTTIQNNKQAEVESNGTLATHIKCDYIISNINSNKTWKHIQTHKSDEEMNHRQEICGATSKLE